MVITSSYLLPCLVATVFLLLTSSTMVEAEDPYLFFTWNVSYGIRSPLGIPQRVILINNQFPGPNLNTTTNNNIVVNVFNQLDEPLLFTWNGIQQRKNSWYDGMPGTNCPIPPGQNFTYHFQVKDQIGSFYYYPTTNFQKAAGGFGGLRINSRPLIPVPFPDPEEDYTVLIGDWYTRSHPALRNTLDAGKTIGKPNGVLINGRRGKSGDEPMFNMMPGKTYRYRICNVGLKNTLNFRIQGHQMKLVEIEGSHTVQNYYDSLDVHLGQCYSVLVTADQQPIKDYYMVASARFTNYVLQTTATIRYAGSNGNVASDNAGLPPAPTGWAFSLNQFRSFRWNLTASAARPNPQGSYHYGQINITRTVKLVNGVGSVDGKLRYGINGASHVDPETPLKLAQYFGVQDKVFVYDAIVTDDTTEGDDGGTNKIMKLAPVVINATFRNFVEIVFENHEKSIQFYHLSGYSFSPVAMEVGTWSPEKRKNYNLIDAVSRYSIQVYPKSWTAILLTFDNAGMWNLRSECLEKYYLGQQLYVSVQSPERSLRDEYDIPSNALRFGIVSGLSGPPRP